MLRNSKAEAECQTHGDYLIIFIIIKKNLLDKKYYKIRSAESILFD